MVEFCVVQCTFCHTFQGQQVKKEKKWTCKMCGEKQSFRKIFGQGSGKECRVHIQILNKMKGNMDREMGKNREEMVNDVNEPVVAQGSVNTRTSESKWQQFVDQQGACQVYDDDDEKCSVTTDREYFRIEARKRKVSVSSGEQMSKQSRKIQVKAKTRPMPRNRHNLSNNNDGTRIENSQYSTQTKAEVDPHQTLKKELTHSETKPIKNNLIKPSSKWSKFT